MNKVNSFSVVIISFNRPEDTLEAIYSVLENDNNLVEDIVVINNNSSVDYSEFELKVRELPKVNYIISSENLGVAGGRNLGIKNVASQYIFFLDDDAVIKSNVFETALNKFESHSNIDVIAFQSVDYNSNELRLNEFPHHVKRKACLNEFYTSHYIGVAHFIRTSAFDKLGMYPEDFFYGMEEYDFSYRVIASGQEIYYSSDLKVYHKKTVEGRLPPNQVLYMLSLNKIRVAKRYLPLPLIFTHYIAWCFRFAIKTRFKSVLLFKLLIAGLKSESVVKKLMYKDVYKIFKMGNKIFY